MNPSSGNFIRLMWVLLGVTASFSLLAHGVDDDTRQFLMANQGVSVILPGDRLSIMYTIVTPLFILGAGLLLMERHTYTHVHEVTAHDHFHRHDDNHHTHKHPTLASSVRHSHRHIHEPEIHHRHKHESREE